MGGKVDKSQDYKLLVEKCTYKKLANRQHMEILMCHIDQT